MTVAHNDGLAQTDLVDRIGIDRHTVAEMVRRMQRKGCCSAGAGGKTRAPTP